MNKEKQTKTEIIAKLLLEGKSRVEVAKLTDSHYSFVHSIAKKTNLQLTAQPRLPQQESISHQIRTLYDLGKSKLEIKKELNIDYSFVQNVIKSYEYKKGKSEL